MTPYVFSYALFVLTGFCLETEARDFADPTDGQKVRLYLQEGKNPQAIATLRSFLFKNPYHTPVKKFLKTHAPLPFTFWFHIPPDAVWLTWFFITAWLLFLFYGKRGKTLKMALPTALALYTGGAFYFYHRHFVSYGTVIKTQPLLSAPTRAASSRWEVPVLSLVKIKQRKAPFIQIHLSKNQTGWIPQDSVIFMRQGNQPPGG